MILEILTDAQGDSPIDFTYDDQPNIPITIFEDGGDDNRAGSPTVFVREQGQLYTQSTLADTGSTLGGDIARFLLSNRVDDNITATDNEVETLAPYTSMTYTRLVSPQQTDIGGVDYPFDRIIDANGATIEEAHTFAQYLLRQNSDIDENASGENGKTADLFGTFNGSDYIATQGVFFNNLAVSSRGQLNLTDTTGQAGIKFPSVSSGALGFTSNLTSGGAGTYTLFYKTPVTGNPYGTGTGQVIVEDANGNPITGNITGTTIDFDFAYSQNTQAGFAANTDREVVLVGINPAFAKFQKAEGFITDSTALSFSLVAQDDTAHEDYV